jgi:predicted ArsR family transcriptional regulator
MTIKEYTMRRRFIVECLSQGDSVRLSDVADDFRCAESTIRNDLKFLRSIGLEVRTRNGILQAGLKGKATLVRKLEFPPEYKESAVSILSYFSRIVEQKYPDIDAAVSIRQTGNTVTLTVETDEGRIETIEKTLTDYGLVVTGKKPAAEMFNDPAAILELNNRLEVAKLELKLKEQAHLMLASQQEHRIKSLETQLSEVRSLVGAQLATSNRLSSVIETLVNADRLSPALSRAIDTLTTLLSAEHSEENESKVAQALKIIRSEDRGLFDRLSSSISSIGHSVAANMATPWVVALLNSLPR